MHITRGRTTYQGQDGGLEDRSRGKFFKICSIPETVKTAELHDHFYTILKETLPEIADAELAIDRIHRPGTKRYGCAHSFLPNQRHISYKHEKS